MIHSLRVAAVCCVTLATSTFGHDVITRYRSAVNRPDVPGYVALKCDFHIHTVFSDGKVWPTVRSEEGWRERLDAIANTERHFPDQIHLQVNVRPSVSERASSALLRLMKTIVLMRWFRNSVVTL